MRPKVGGDGPDLFGDEVAADEQETAEQVAALGVGEAVVVEHQEAIDLVVHLARGTGNGADDGRLGAAEDDDGEAIALRADKQRVHRGRLVRKPVGLGDGKRVKKIAGSEETNFVYDAGGELIGEYSSIVQTGSNAKTVYTTNDHLGSPRINTDGVGTVISRHDYHPFAEEIARTGYGSDTIRKQFTGNERDDETGLDFAQARYHSSNLGRFSSPDPLLESGKASLPQTWNRYVYTLNNPVNLVDSTGLMVDDFFINRDGSYVVVENDCKCHNYYIETANGSGEYRSLTTLQENAQGQVEFPAEMDFFGRYGTVDAGGGGDHGAGDHFLNPDAAAALFGLSAVLKDDKGITMSYGDMSSSNGRDPWQKGFDHHAGHGHDSRSGQDVDFRYIDNNGNSFQGKSSRKSADFSVTNNQAVFDTAKTFGFTENYQGTDQGGKRLTGVPTAAKHNDHGHLGFDPASARVTKAQAVTSSGTLYKPVFFRR